MRDNRGNPRDSTRAATDGHRLSEFIYGTVTGMVAVAGLSGGSQDAMWWQAGAIIVVGAAAVWVAHAYSQLIGRRMATGHPLTSRDLGQTLRGAWPIVSAGLLLTMPLLLAGIGVCPVGTALRISSVLGVVILALVGWFAGVPNQDSWSRRLVLSAMAAGLGLCVVAAEILVHR